MTNIKPTSIEDYIQTAPEIAKEKLIELRNLLKSVVPNAKESLKWGKPVFELKTILFAYSAHKAHLSFIPTGPALQPFEKALTNYKVNQDSVQFPYNKPLPIELIKKIAEHRVKEVVENNAKWRY